VQGCAQRELAAIGGHFGLLRLPGSRRSAAAAFGEAEIQLERRYAVRPLLDRRSQYRPVTGHLGRQLVGIALGCVLLGTVRHPLAQVALPVTRDVHRDALIPLVARFRAPAEATGAHLFEVGGVVGLGERRRKCRVAGIYLKVANLVPGHGDAFPVVLCVIALLSYL
jgi:hypothetical protein